MSIRYRCFFCGYLFCCGLRMFQQDMIGLDKYLNFVTAGWVFISPWWGIGVMILAIIGCAKTK